jgi:hypothetical protein
MTSDDHILRTGRGSAQVPCKTATGNTRPQQHRDAVIIEQFRAGATMVDCARAAGISKQRVLQILRKHALTLLQQRQAERSSPEYRQARREARREVLREKCRRYRARNRDRINARLRERRRADADYRERANARQRQYHHANRQRLAPVRRAWTLANREHLRRYRARNRDRIRAWHRKYRARKTLARKEPPQ